MSYRRRQQRGRREEAASCCQALVDVTEAVWPGDTDRAATKLQDVALHTHLITARYHWSACRAIKQLVVVTGQELSHLLR